MVRFRGKDEYTVFHRIPLLIAIRVNDERGSRNTVAQVLPPPLHSVPVGRIPRMMYLLPVQLEASSHRARGRSS